MSAASNPVRPRGVPTVADWEDAADRLRDRGQVRRADLCEGRAAALRERREEQARRVRQQGLLELLGQIASGR